MRAKLFMTLGALVIVGWAVPMTGAAPFIVRAATRVARSDALMPLPSRIRFSRERGILVNVWINGKGPFVFAVDTGSELNVITQQVVAAGGLATRATASGEIAGLTGLKTRFNREALINMALGTPRNLISGSKSAVIVASLAPGVDGILDPTDIYSPFGYSIDLPNQRIEALDTTLAPLEKTTLGGEGAAVPWLRFDDSERPFVRLGDGRVALVDTGSSFGLAVNGRDAIIRGNNTRRQRETGNDIGGGQITSQRVAPTTITIGALVLHRVPTDILFGVADDAPVILGRDLLAPFKITFDPQRRLIEFVTSEKN